MPKDPIIKKSASIPTFLVANGISYLGLNLCVELLEKGARVVALDVVTDEVRERASELLLNPNFALFNVDLNEGIPDKIQSVDYIFQLMFPDDLGDQGGEDLVSQAFGTKNLLDLAVASKSKFALIEPLFSLTPTKDENPSYSYDKNSEFLRSLVWDYVQKKKLDGRIVRLGPIYGPNMPLESLEGIGGFLLSILSGEPLRIHGDGAEKIPYLYISDAIDGLIKALFYKKTSGRIFKILGEDLHADLELAFVLRSMSNADLKMAYVDKPKDFLLTIDTSQGEQMPRWTPEVNLKAGLKKTLESFGYDTNLHSFKPTKMIEDKLKEELPEGKRTVSKTEAAEAPNLKGPVKPVEEINSLISYQDHSEALQKKIEKLGLKEVEKKKKAFPKIKFPTINFPRISRSPKLLKEKTPKKVSTKILKPVSKRSNFQYVFFGIFVAALFTLIAPLTLTAYYSKKALSSLEQVSLDLEQLQTESSQESARQAFTHFIKAKNSFKRMRWVFNLVNKESFYFSLDSTLESSVYFTGALYRTSRALDPFNSVWEVLKPTSSQTFEEKDFAYSIQELTYARRSMDLALANFDQVSLDALPDFFVSRITKYGDILDRSDTLLRETLLVADSLPNVLGVNKEQKYLLLFQNSNEIRPTGGFIGSYGLLTLKDGKIGNLVIDDIYNPDGQIDVRKISSDIPAPLKEFLNEDVLHIRNANWSPDFPQTVSAIEDLFFKLENRSFDGVVALDLNLIKSLLQVTGPVFLAAYNEEINAENVYERTQFHAEFDYEEGISEKRSFMTILGGKLMEKVFALPAEKLPEFGSVVSSALDSRSLQVSLKDPVISSYLADKKWNGGMVSTEGDFLMVVNANLGGTKANYFVENAYEYSITSDTRDGLLRASLHMNYKHNGEDNAWPGGPYTDYVRIYAPAGAKLTGAKLVRNGQDPQDIFAQVSTGLDLGKTVFATSFVLQPKELLRLEISYDLPTSLSLAKEVKDYSLYWQKQAGTKDDLFRFSFKGPFGTEISSYKPAELGKEKNIAILEGKLNQDQAVELSLK